jgi:hypothetical protein
MSRQWFAVFEAAQEISAGRSRQKKENGKEELTADDADGRRFFERVSRHDNAKVGAGGDSLCCDEQMKESRTKPLRHAELFADCAG